MLPSLTLPLLENLLPVLSSKGWKRGVDVARWLVLWTFEGGLIQWFVDLGFQPESKSWEKNALREQP
ncbi:hypothetical protein I79_019364 [Cricetulus griseus]|uniref:Uncharacterized protein n=1 Tax=Cricetulus griseus TaxID=10029 RepID=G3I779_CRIGR|nr:hypothetical protein I79_019364 [Cricetulus griseus]